MAKPKTTEKKRLTEKSKSDFLCGRSATMWIGRLKVCDECASATNEAPLSKLSVDDSTSIDGPHETLSGSGNGNEMNSHSKAVTRSEIEAQKRREAREKKPTREWTAAERREAFLEARRLSAREPKLGLWTNGTCATNATNTSASGARPSAATASTAVVNTRIDADKLLSRSFTALLSWLTAP